MTEYVGQITGPVSLEGGGTVLSTGTLGTEPAAHAVCLAREPLDSGSYSSVIYQARITVSAGSYSYSFDCDWGAQFSLVCSQLTIDAVAVHMQHEAVPVSEDTTTRWRHTAIVGFAGWNAARAPTLTLPQKQIPRSNAAPPSGPATGIPVPPFARRVYPRIGIMTTVVGAEQACDPISRADIERINMRQVTIGADPSVYDSGHWLTPESVRHGVALANVAYLSFAAPYGSPEMLITPFFELGL